jgi:hypothetical protein
MATGAIVALAAATFIAGVASIYVVRRGHHANDARDAAPRSNAQRRPTDGPIDQTIRQRDPISDRQDVSIAVERAQWRSAQFRAAKTAALVSAIPALAGTVIGLASGNVVLVAVAGGSVFLAGIAAAMYHAKQLRIKRALDSPETLECDVAER